MYDDIIDLAMDQQLLTEINNRSINYRKLPVWRELHSKSEEEMQALEQQLTTENKLTFHNLFDEPVGYYFIKSYLESQHSIDKAIFIRDVEIFKTLHDYDTRKETAHKIYDAFCGPESPNRVKGTSCLADKNTKAHLNDNTVNEPSKSNQSNTKFESSQITQFDPKIETSEITEFTDNHRLILPHTSNEQHLLKQPEDSTTNMNADSADQMTSVTTQSNSDTFQNPNHMDNVELSTSMNTSSLRHPTRDNCSSVSNNFFSDDANAIGCYGKPVKKLRGRLQAGNCDLNLFDEVVQQILADLKLDVFPRFLKSTMFDMYLRCKSLEYKEITMNAFHPMRMLGRGAFGTVNACKKKDTGRLYAMKQIDKRRVQATDSVRSLIAERDFLSLMDSRFVTSLKYAFMDEERLYLVMDLMTGGDLKYHLNHDGIFAENRARFYAAQILLGLEHIHDKGIIYRDLKLENVLVDERGYLKISDLGLAVSIDDGLVRGYAGTPGYTAPEVVLTQYYNQQVDFFSLGVVIYRSICGKKPFAKKKTGEMRGNDMDRMKKTSIELDRNVVEMSPPFDNPRFTPKVKNLCRGMLHKNPKYRLGINGFNEIKEHPWFDCIDWAMLEAGKLDSPFIPPFDEIHAEQQQYIGRPPDDDKYAKIKITPEFIQSLEKFPFKSSKVMQSELVDVLEQVHSDRRQFNGKDGAAENFDIYAFPAPHEITGKHHCLGGCIII